MSAQETIDTTCNDNDEKYFRYLESRKDQPSEGMRLMLLKKALSNSPPKDITPEILQKYYDAGLIPKKQLKPGSYYWGTCRHSKIAMWDAKKEVFWYIRTKWPDFEPFIESIHCIEDDNGYDLFLPLQEVKWQAAS